MAMASGGLGAPIFRHAPWFSWFILPETCQNPGLLMMRWQVLVAKNQKKMAGEVTHCWVLKPWIPPHANLPSSPPSHLHLPPEGCVLPKPRRRCCRTFYSQNQAKPRHFARQNRCRLQRQLPSLFGFPLLAQHNGTLHGDHERIDHTRARGSKLNPSDFWVIEIYWDSW